MDHMPAELERIQAELNRFDRLAGDDLSVFGEGLVYASVCTSLDDAASDALMAQRLSGTDGGWKRSADPTFASGEPNPCPCERSPDSRRHILYEV